ncbi:MAG TPA: NADH-quinone oxidoreductase subunit J [Candidatus Saccharimonadales bacterium]|nr:NADH-quinone oxidoreductase subunit J [Candidatus Saccharimonadales bacterium]
MTLSFAITAFIILGSGIAAVSMRSLVHSALALTVTFAGLAAAYLQLGAQFVGFAQILVYIGAVAILVVFAILLTRGTGDLAHAPRRLPWTGVIIALLAFSTLAGVIRASHVLGRPASETPAVAVKEIGNKLMGEYVVPLEILGLLLTAALIGAAIIAMQEKPGVASTALRNEDRQEVGVIVSENT